MRWTLAACSVVAGECLAHPGHGAELGHFHVRDWLFLVLAIAVAAAAAVAIWYARGGK